MTITLRPIGVIHTPFATKEQAPIHGAFHPEATGVVEVYPEFEDGLTDVESFSHLILLYEFDRHGPVNLLQPTFLSEEPHGLFACRRPARVNPIGLTVVKLLQRDGAKLIVGNVDMLDGTPLLDIKPYVRRFDCFPGANEGWLEGRQNGPKPAGRE
jgi:tRNA-Thr(GGU) m(6)t(6)A37 methyltransferase TsaA